eukprot:1899331-Pleurochrysis_carterae.AAC.1
MRISVSIDTGVASATVCSRDFKFISHRLYVIVPDLFPALACAEVLGADDLRAFRCCSLVLDSFRTAKVNAFAVITMYNEQSLRSIRLQARQLSSPALPLALSSPSHVSSPSNR